MSDEHVGRPPAGPVPGGPEGIEALTAEIVPALIARLRASRLGELEVRVDGDMVTLVEGGNLAGSVTALDLELRNVVDHGVPLAEAVRAAASNPAELLGLHDRGRLAVGLRADLVELDAASYAVRRVMRGGEWIVRR